MKIFLLLYYLSLLAASHLIFCQLYLAAKKMALHYTALEFSSLLYSANQATAVKLKPQGPLLDLLTEDNSGAAGVECLQSVECLQFSSV